MQTCSTPSLLLGDSLGVQLGSKLPELLLLAQNGATASHATNNNLLQQVRRAPPVNSKCSRFALVSIGANDFMQNQTDSDVENGFRQAHKELMDKGYQLYLLKMATADNFPSKALLAAQFSGAADPLSSFSKKWQTLQGACESSASSKCAVMDLTDIHYETGLDNLHLSDSAVVNFAAAAQERVKVQHNTNPSWV